MKIAFLTGSDSPSTRRAIEAVCSLPGLELAGILLDTDVPTFKRRQKNLLRNIRINGWSYAAYRVLEAISSVTTGLIDSAVVDRREVRSVLKKAFPHECFSLEDISKKFNIPLYEVGNINGPKAVSVLGQIDADLGIVLGTRILKPVIFSVPKRGCINLHKGKVPEFRGMPPGFWELYEGVPSAGITVHFVDKGLDTGDIVATSSIPISKMETPESLLEKLHVEGVNTLVRAVTLLRDGKATLEKQPKGTVKTRTKPTREEMDALAKRLPHWVRKSDASIVLRNLYLLFIYYSGIYFLVRQFHRLSRSRAAIFLYHRVNDFAKDPLTVDRSTFAAQLLAISRRYPVSSSESIVDRLKSAQPLVPTTVAIHFDDCYRDVVTGGGPILKTLGLPACAFINSGYIDTDRTFPHDESKYPFKFEMMRSSDVQSWSNLGFEVGAHTVNHLDLGTLPLDTATYEIQQCGKDLERLTGKRIGLFSFPFGRKHNITPQTREIIQRSGYVALFSAHGGTIDRNTDVYDIPRAGAHYELSPLYCLLQVEGLTLTQISAKLRGKG